MQIKKLAKQTALYGLSSIATRVLAFAFLTPYLTYKFKDNLAAFGIQTDLYAWAAFLLIFFTYRMETAMFRFGSKQEDLLPAFRVAALSIIAATALLGGLLLLIAQPLANWLEYPDSPEFVSWIILIVALDALVSIPFALLRLQEKALNFAVIKIINMFTYLGLVYFFYEAGPYLYGHQLLGADYWYAPGLGIGYVFIANLIANIITLGMLSPAYIQLFKPEPGIPFFDQALWVKMSRYAMPLVVVGLAAMINEVFDRVLLKALLPGSLDHRLAEVGIYGACYKIAIFMNLLTQAFNYAAEPFFFKHAQKDGSRQLYADVALLFTIAGCLTFLGVMLFMDIFQYFVAPSYRSGIFIVPILLLANLFLGLYYNVATWYKLADKTAIGANISLIGAAVTIVANLVLVPILGYSGAAWATLACYATMLVLCYIRGQEHYPVPYSVTKILQYIGAAIAVYALYALLRVALPNASLLSFFLGLVFWLAYLGGIWKLEGKQLRQIIKR